MSAAFAAQYTLVQVIDLALDECKGLSNNTVADWIEANYPEILSEPKNDEMLRHHGLCDVIGRRRKARTPLEEVYSSKNLCLDFGLPHIQLDSEIAIPLDLSNVLGGQNEWKTPDEASLEDIDAHIVLLEAQAAANLAKANDWKRVRQAAAKYAGGNLQLTLGELRKIAHRRSR